MAKKKEETKEEKKERGYFSRKFIVWIVTSLFVLMAFILSFITKSEGTVLEKLIPWWGSVSLVYIGGNVAQKAFLEGKSE